MDWFKFSFYGYDQVLIAVNLIWIGSHISVRWNEERPWDGIKGEAKKKSQPILLNGFLMVDWSIDCDIARKWVNSVK